MRVIQSGSCNVLAGGPALSTWLTIKGLRENGVEVDLISQPFSKGRIIAEELQPKYSEKSKYGRFAYVPHFASALDELDPADIYHIQGLWMLYGTQMANYANKQGRPYVVTLRGMLYPQALAHNPLIKKLSLLLYQGKTLRNAAAIQCTCIEEMEHYRKLGFKNPVAVIPNPIETEGVVDKPIPEKRRFRIGYLGRVHPRKRIERLIYAMHDLKNKLPNDAELLIIGGGDSYYENFLHSEVEKLNLKDKVRFTGFLSGEDKEKAINSLSLLAVPSDFENFGNIVTEALVHGVPVIASKGMPWQELPLYGCGWWIENNQQSINDTMLKACMIGPEALKDMGGRGKRLMVENYSIDVLGKKMKALYEWILRNGEKPDFVFC